MGRPSSGSSCQCNDPRQPSHRDDSRVILIGRSAILALLMLLLPQAPRTGAAECEGLPPTAIEAAATEDNFRDTSVAVIGVATRVSEESIELDVRSVLRGASGSLLEVRDHPAESIAVEFVQGKLYFVAAVEMPDGSLQTSACKGTRTITLAEASRLEAISGVQQSATPVDGIALIMLALAAILLGAVSVIAFRRRWGNSGE